MVDVELLVLGGGVTGLAAAAGMGDRAVVIERDARPGGLVRTECFDGYWFDRVLHVLHFQDPALRDRTRALLGGVLAPCPPEAWVETAAGTARFPIQLHLGGLRAEARVRCLEGLARAACAPAPPDGGGPPAYDQFLLASFGPALCELFYFPYNRKLWRRPLDALVPAGQTWNLQRPSLADAIRGAFPDAPPRGGYNEDAFYPRPPADAPCRGMEVLARALAARVRHLSLATEVEEIDPARRTVTARRGGERVVYRYGACLCTLPLPAAMRMCVDAPPALREAAAALPHNAVLSAAFSVRGPRPAAPGQWRYYTDESLCFTRLVHMTELDPMMAPADGWGVLAEIPVRSGPRAPDAEVLARARRDLARAGALPPGCRVVDARLMAADPAYVVFTRGADAAARACRDWLAERGIAALGRYGRWEYSSMSRCMAQGIRWAESARAGVPWADGEAALA
ncbi:MAG TPA: FAD-dependent oxidoreductase [Longimicrobium sp.]|jgi:protoporphyrinogen oxidase|uniref:protoporphyrinogen/coproporphyrinogen oxidase n=1 Tax=Longimicrobium sp. TaxID=2029185 RepID=UPI002EDB8795